MHPIKGRRTPAARLVIPLLVLGTVALLYLPAAIGFSTGITKDNEIPDFQEMGCVLCHGPPGDMDHEFTSTAFDRVRWNITPVEADNDIRGNVYVGGAVYEIHIALPEPQNPGDTNLAGFNLRVSAGQLEGVADVSQTSDDGMEATHVRPALSEWTVLWTAPAGEVTVFDLFVNDVDGDGSPSDDDLVYRLGWFLAGDHGQLPGAAVDDEEVHLGVPLPQYWIGLLALAGMLFIMLFAFVYMKFMSPHSKDQKDR